MITRPLLRLVAPALVAAGCVRYQAGPMALEKHQAIWAERNVEVQEVAAFVCAAWVGRTEKVADEQCRPTTEVQFTRAASVCTVLQNPVQQAHAEACIALHASGPRKTKTAFVPVSGGIGPEMACDGSGSVGWVGFEPTSKRL